MDKYYSAERNTQMLITLMKLHGIKKIIISPGATNVCFVGSVQNDPYFEVYSCVDERSAAYMACGLSADSGEVVALSCTGATASRNYYPGLTEAFYRQLPILAITSTQHIGKVGNFIPQVIDRSVQPKDSVKMSVEIPIINSNDDEWACNVRINKALLELNHRGKGPVHINLATSYNPDFSIKELPNERAIFRIDRNDNMPNIENKVRVALFVGNHIKFDDKTVLVIEKFCEKYNGVVFCDRISNYFGKYRINPCIIGCQMQYKSPLLDIDLLIHIGSITGTDNNMGIKPKEVWRINKDGEIRDPFRKLKYVFEMEEYTFFNHYTMGSNGMIKNEYYDCWKNEVAKFYDKIPELPFSNAWVAQKTLPILPRNSTIHFGILNSLRSWNYFEFNDSLIGFSNTGGFGIDGCVSTLIGASLLNENKLYFGVVGDLAFFYDMNSLGNRHISNNIRLMVINNGRGQEFRNASHHAARFGDDADKYMAAAGHFGNKSYSLIKHFAEDLGFEYLSADSKESFIDCIDRFIDKKISSKSIILEIFTDTELESEAFNILHNLESTASGSLKKIVKGILGEKGTKMIKKITK